MYINSVINQLKIAVDSTVIMFERIEESKLLTKPLKGATSELCEHISLLIAADINILNGKTETEMKDFYNENSGRSLEEMKVQLLTSFKNLVEIYSNYTSQELFEIKKAYWGVSYSRYEWLLEILVHFYHHRAQLHMLIREQIDGGFSLFE
ncbi:MAG: hypothetical protein K0S51_451 [Bacillales bacterium]|jgi:uncharacterized damage-inducible protein DinB|nr:hypothetical protein [Bacillales bacterium]